MSGYTASEEANKSISLPPSSRPSSPFCDSSPITFNTSFPPSSFPHHANHSTSTQPAVDLPALYPAALTPTALTSLRTYYHTTYRDQFFSPSGPPTAWFGMFLWMEALYHVPLSLWAIPRLYRGTSSSSSFFLPLRPSLFIHMSLGSHSISILLTGILSTYICVRHIWRRECGKRREGGAAADHGERT